jgi:hypothetical protein
VFSAKATRATGAIYERTATALEKASSWAPSSFPGGAFRLEPPPVPDPPPPVTLGQTIALDIKGNWWTRWWRRRRSYAAFAEEFSGMIDAEIAPMIEALKQDHADVFRDMALKELRRFVAGQRTTLMAMAGQAEERLDELRARMAQDTESQGDRADRGASPSGGAWRCARKKRNEFMMMSDAPLRRHAPDPQAQDRHPGRVLLRQEHACQCPAGARVLARPGDGHAGAADLVYPWRGRSRSSWTATARRPRSRLDEVASVPVEGTQFVRVFLEAPILERLDFIDMPGSSDPNMSPDIWNAILPQADAVIWCTPATQAWRQSEAAIWDEVDPDVQERSVLLVTRIDKVLSDSRPRAADEADAARDDGHVPRHLRGGPDVGHQGPGGRPAPSAPGRRPFRPRRGPAERLRRRARAADRPPIRARRPPRCCACRTMPPPRAPPVPPRRSCRAASRRAG